MMYDFSPKLLDVKTGDYRRNIAQDSRISRYGIEIPIHHHHTVTALPSTIYLVPDTETYYMPVHLHTGSIPAHVARVDNYWYPWYVLY